MVVVVITGVAGLIGSNFARYLLESDDSTDLRIIGVDNLSGGSPSNVPMDYDGRLTFLKADLTVEADVLMVEAAIQAQTGSEPPTNRPDTPWFLVHCAAYAAEILSPFIRGFNVMNNVWATSRLISLAIKHRCKRFVYLSSFSVYGHQEPPFEETTTTPAPADPYALAKLYCENDLKIAWQQHQLEHCVLRPHNVYGVGQSLADPYRNVIGIFMRQVLEGAPLTIYGDGQQRRAFTDVRDILRPMWCACFSSVAANRVYNIGSDFAPTVVQVAKMVIKAAGKATADAEAEGEKAYPIQYLPKRHEAHQAYCTHVAAATDLELLPTIHVEDGVQHMWSWVKAEARSRSGAILLLRRMRAYYEVTRGMPPSWQ